MFLQTRRRAEPFRETRCNRVVEGRPLVERARRGDARAFEELVAMHAQIAFRTAYLITGSAADAEDAAQEGFVKAWRALWRFRPGAEFRPWLLKIVANEARNRRRSVGRRAGLVLRAAREVSGEAAPSPEATLVDAERREALLEAVAALPEPARLAIACRYFLDLSEDETAAVLGVRRGTVKSRTARGLERLRAEVGE
jgi:RNA polymerase sigma factor (sigma-70 family)